VAKLVFGLGVAMSLAILGIALLGTPATSARATQSSARVSTGRSIQALPLEEGYGVSRTVLLRTCAD
jgi:hypothetical protein